MRFPLLAASFVTIVWFFPFRPLYAQPSLRHQMATNHLKRVAAELLQQSLANVHSLEDWKTRQPELRRQLLDMLGLDPLPPRTPLRPRVTGILEREQYRIEKIFFESSPGLYVTGNFYLPTGGKAAPRPAILYLCGHAPHPAGAKVNYQDRAAWFASHGFACLILDTLEFGEVPGIHHGLHDLNMWHWLSLGYTPAGTEVWNAMRALDYLESRPEIDRQRIGVTGISGGGATTWYLAAVDERVAAAAPVCSTFTFASQAANWRAAGQCDCIYFPNTYGWDFPVVAALIAPRPLLIISGQKDWDFPPDGYHEVFHRAKRIYDFYAEGPSDRVEEFDDAVGHSDPPQFLRAARQWMRRWLQHQVVPLELETNSVPRESAADLAVLDQLPPDAINYRIQHQLTPAVLPQRPRSRSKWKIRRAELLDKLQSQVFPWFPREPIPFDTQFSRNDGGWVARYADYKEATFQTEPGVTLRVQLLTPRHEDTNSSLLIYVKRAGDSIYAFDYDELLPVLGRRPVLVLHPRFTELPPGPAENAVLQMTSAWTGRTIASMQTWDILRSIDWALAEQKVTSGTVVLYGKGEMGILAIYAALFDPRVDKVILNDPPASHWQGPALLNILRVTDIAEAAAALAPRSLISLTELPQTFELTRAIYLQEGVARNLKLRGSLPEALDLGKNESR